MPDLKLQINTTGVVILALKFALENWGSFTGYTRRGEGGSPLASAPMNWAVVDAVLRLQLDDFAALVAEAQRSGGFTMDDAKSSPAMDTPVALETMQPAEHAPRFLDDVRALMAAWDDPDGDPDLEAIQRLRIELDAVARPL